MATLDHVKLVANEDRTGLRLGVEQGLKSIQREQNQ